MTTRIQVKHSGYHKDIGIFFRAVCWIIFFLHKLEVKPAAETQLALGYARSQNSRALPKTRLAASFPLGGCSSWDLSISKSAEGRTWELSVHKWYERGSHLLSCCRGCSWYHYHRVQVHTPMKDTKNQFPSTHKSTHLPLPKLLLIYVSC